MGKIQRTAIPRPNYSWVQLQSSLTYIEVISSGRVPNTFERQKNREKLSQTKICPSLGFESRQRGVLSRQIALQVKTPWSPIRYPGPPIQHHGRENNVVTNHINKSLQLLTHNRDFL